jgi:hypothetical protein
MGYSLQRPRALSDKRPKITLQVYEFQRATFPPILEALLGVRVAVWEYLW